MHQNSSASEGESKQGVSSNGGRRGAPMQWHSMHSTPPHALCMLCPNNEPNIPASQGLACPPHPSQSTPCSVQVHGSTQNAPRVGPEFPSTKSDKRASKWVVPLQVGWWVERQSPTQHCLGWLMACWKAGGEYNKNTHPPPWLAVSPCRPRSVKVEEWWCAATLATLALHPPSHPHQNGHPHQPNGGEPEKRVTSA